MVKNKIINWVKNNKVEILVVFILLLLASFLRFYRLSEYMNFLGDEGRDALMIKRILVDHDFPLLGPPTSVGNIYLGPLYYYMMAIPMAIFWLNPVAATGMVAFLGVLTVFLVYYLARSWFGTVPAILAAYLYAISPVTITYSRSSWNPNPAPLFALLAIFGFDKARKSRNFLWLVLTGASLAACIQMHYLSLILLPVFGILWLWDLRSQTRQHLYRHFFLGSFFSIIIFILLLSPLIIFDFKYNFLNYRAITAMFSAKDSSLQYNFLENFSRIIPIYKDKLIGRYLCAENNITAIIISILVIIPMILTIFKRRIKIYSIWPNFVLAIWLVIGIIGLSFYKQSIFDHYLGFLNPVPYLLIASTIAFLSRKWQIIAIIVFAIWLGVLNISRNPLLFSPNRQLERTQLVSKFIIEKSNNLPFNFALISKNNYDSAYQFYLGYYGYKPKILPIEITDQLFVVCEDTTCDPVYNSKYEIVSFGWSKIRDVDTVWGVRVYKLIHNPSGRPS